MSASPVASWATQDAGTAAIFGNEVRGRHLDVYTDGSAVALDRDGVVHYRAAGSSDWNALTGPAYLANSQVNSIAISSPTTFYVGSYGGSDNTERKVIRYDYNIGNESWEFVATARPDGGNRRVEAIWTNRDPASVAVVASLQGATTAHYYSATGSTASNGTGWTAVTGSPSIASAFSVGSSASNIVGVRYNGNAPSRSTDGGQSWTTITATLPFNPNSVTAAGDDYHWIVGANGGIAFYDASVATPTYEVQFTPTSENLTSIWAISETSVWAVGLNDSVLHYNGVAWTSVNVGTTGIDFYGVAADALGNVTIVGSGGTILYGAIPEPSAYALLLGAAGLGTVLMRRGHR